MAKFYYLSVVFAVLMLVSPAQAHKVIASVFPSGKNIEGEIGFSNGDMAKNTLVEVFDENGDKMGEATTDTDGFFTFTPTKAVNHVFRADLGAGHVAEVIFDISEMSHLAGVKADNTASSGAVSSDKGITPENKSEEISEAQEELIASVVRDELRPLRREIAAYKEKNDLQSILGGIGYIFGAFGIAFYVAARRLKGKVQQA